MIHQHLQSIKLASQKLYKSPGEHITSLFIMIIFITLLFLLLSLTKTTTDWEQNSLQYPQIMVFLKDKSSSNDVSNLENTINRYYKKHIAGYEFISKQQGFKELKNDDKINEIIDSNILENDNPLPDILIVKSNTANSVLLKKMSEHIKNMPNVDSISLNNEYINKVSDFVSFLHYITVIVELSFIVIIAITIFNTIRLQMFINRDEILVSRLIGAPDTFIMRPLAYFALMQITLSTIISYLLYTLIIKYANITLTKYSHLFGNKFSLINLNFEEIIQLYIVLFTFTIFAVFTAVKSVFKHNTLN